ncbi:hypothetical protein RFI_40366, partial [Reticulomyxa filosa]
GKKDGQIIELTKMIKSLNTNVQQLEIDMNQNNDELKKQFEHYKEIIQTNFKNQNQNLNIEQFQIQIKTQNKTEEKEKELDINELKCNKNCQNMVSLLIFPSLKNGLDFLLMNENDQTIHLKNNEWNNYNLGIYLLGKNITLT